MTTTLTVNASLLVFAFALALSWVDEAFFALTGRGSAEESQTIETNETMESAA